MYNDKNKHNIMYPVSKSIASVLIVVFALYATNVVTNVPCTPDIQTVFISNFVHTDMYHILANLIALYALLKIEKRIGSKMFLSLILFLLGLITLIEVGMRRVIPDLQCSIGFSGVLIGVFVWELIGSKGGKIDLAILASIAVFSVGPSLIHSNVSLSAHIIGAISGLIGGLIYTKIA